MGRFGRKLRFVFLLILALLLVDLIYGYVMGQPTAQYIEIGLHVIAVILVLGSWSYSMYAREEVFSGSPFMVQCIIQKTMRGFCG